MKLGIKRWLNNRLQKAGKSGKAKMIYIWLNLISITQLLGEPVRRVSGPSNLLTKDFFQAVYHIQSFPLYEISGLAFADERISAHTGWKARKARLRNL